LAFDKNEVRFELLRIAVELAMHRARNGVYPDSLADLTPSKTDPVPVDPYTLYK
jgi:hypothetical protein